MIMLTLLTTFTFLMMVRSVFVVSGTYKDPVLASFERYGEEERIFSPPISLLIWGACFAYVSLYWYISGSIAMALGIFTVILVGSLHKVASDLLHKYKDFFRKYPPWYDEIIQMTDREERRRIAYMWLFLPAKTRMVYNTNNVLFKQWVEQVLLTVA